MAPVAAVLSNDVPVQKRTMPFYANSKPRRVPQRKRLKWKRVRRKRVAKQRATPLGVRASAAVVAVLANDAQAQVAKKLLISPAS